MKKHHEKDIASQCADLSEMTIGTLQAVTEEGPGNIDFVLIALLNSAAEILDRATHQAHESGLADDDD